MSYMPFLADKARQRIIDHIQCILRLQRIIRRIIRISDRKFRYMPALRVVYMRIRLRPLLSFRIPGRVWTIYRGGTASCYTKDSTPQYSSQVSHQTHRCLRASAVQLQFAVAILSVLHEQLTQTMGIHDNVCLQQHTFCCRGPPSWAKQLHKKHTVTCNILTPLSHVSFTRQASARYANTVTWSRSCRKAAALTFGC